MPEIATLEEFAHFLQVTPVAATADLLLLDLAQGLIADVIGEQDPWPAAARSIALTAAARAYLNPSGASQLTQTSGPFTRTESRDGGELGVYLTDAELDRLRAWLGGPGGSALGQPQGCFPPPRSWPDPAEPCFP